MVHVLDKDGDGQLAIDELPERMRDRYLDADIDGDGNISIEEMENRRPSGRPSAPSAATRAEAPAAADSACGIRAAAVDPMEAARPDSGENIRALIPPL